MLENAPIRRRRVVENVRVGAAESLGAILAGVGLVAQGDGLGGVVCGFEDGHEDALDIGDFDDGGAGFEFFDLGLRAEVEDGRDAEGFELEDSGGGYLRGFGAAEEEVGACCASGGGRGGRGGGA